MQNDKVKGFDFLDMIDTSPLISTCPPKILDASGRARPITLLPDEEGSMDPDPIPPCPLDFLDTPEETPLKTIRNLALLGSVLRTR